MSSRPCARSILLIPKQHRSPSWTCLSLTSISPPQPQVRYGGVEGAGSEVVDYIFVSRLWTVGRTLDEVVHKHQAGLSAAYPPGASETGGSSTGSQGEGGQPASSTASYSFLSPRTGRLLPLTPVLSELRPEELVSCDALVVLPWVAPPPPEAQAGGEAQESQAEGGPLPLLRVAVEGGGLGQSSSVPGGQCDSQGEALGVVSGMGEVGKGSGEPEGAVGQGGEGPEVVITVVQGKAEYPIRFTGADWAVATVADLKARVEAATGVRVYKQKLLFKGTLEDSERLQTSKLRPGCKVMLMAAKK